MLDGLHLPEQAHWRGVPGRLGAALALAVAALAGFVVLGQDLGARELRAPIAAASLGRAVRTCTSDPPVTPGIIFQM